MFYFGLLKVSGAAELPTLLLPLCCPGVMPLLLYGCEL